MHECSYKGMRLVCTHRSRGSPGTMDQWSKVEKHMACPWVNARKSVSNPKLSIAGKYAFTV